MEWKPPVLTDVEYAMQRLKDNEYDDMYEDGYYVGNNERDSDLATIEKHLKQLSTYEALEKRAKEQTGIPLSELVDQYQLREQAFYVACWKLADYDDKSCYDEMEASDAWKDVLIKKAEKQVEELQNAEQTKK